MTDPSESDSPVSSSNRSKVSVVIERYGLDGMGDELEARWLGRDGARQSLRDLADHFNRQVLDAAIRDADGRSVPGEVENLYRLLTDDDVTAGDYAQAEAKLTRLGVDVGTVERDFVSHQAIHTFLTKYRGVDAPSEDRSTGARLEERAETIDRLRNRLVAVTERGLESLQRSADLTPGAYDVVVGVTVYCEACGTSYDVAELLDRGGCGCADRRG